MEDVEKLRGVNPSEKRMPKGMTSEEWDKCFEILKSIVRPSAMRRMRVDYSSLVNGRYDNSYFEYCGDTQWQRYCKFINSVLNVIRSGEEDYCFYIYQISDLLRFEHDRLQSEWIPENRCFKVWLEN